MTNPILSVNGLCVTYHAANTDFAAVKDVSFDLHAGQTLGLVGESGSGKSTIAAAVVGLVDAQCVTTSGAVTLGGRRIDRLSENNMRAVRGARIGVMFQDCGATLDPMFTVGDQIAETMAAHSQMTIAEAKLQSAVMLLRVGFPNPEHVLNEYPHRLSGGQRQRVALALALAGNPDVLLADEPTSALDVVAQANFISLLKDLVRTRGIAALLISHDIGLVSAVADTVAVMHAGSIVEMGARDDVLGSPQSPYTQRLIAAVPSLTPRVAA